MNNSAWQSKRRDEPICLWITTILTSVPPEEVQLLVSPPTKASGNSLRENILSFEALSKTTGGEQLFFFREQIFFELIWHWTSCWSSNRENSWRMRVRDFNSINFQSHRDILRCDLQRNWAFCRWLHHHKEELRSSNELLTAFQKSEGKERWMEEIVSNRMKETNAPEGNKETCANPLSNCSTRLSFLQVKGNWLLLKPHLYEEDICLQKYRKWSQRWYVITIKTNENKMDHIIGRAWDQCCCLHREEQDNFLTISGFVWFMKAAARKESDTAWITRSPCLICEQYRDTLVVFR